LTFSAKEKGMEINKADLFGKDGSNGGEKAEWFVFGKEVGGEDKKKDHEDVVVIVDQHFQNEEWIKKPIDDD